MSWWGKLLGGTFGMMIGGPLGALLGTAIGHGLDRGLHTVRSQGQTPDTERVQQAFFAATFSIMGHLAKSDGRVSEREIDMARAVMGHMQLSEEQRQAAIRLFNQGKREDFPLQQVLAQFRSECQHRRNLLQMFLEIQITTIVADGVVAPQERELLHHVGNFLGFSSFDIDYLVDIVRAQHSFADSGDYTAQQAPRLELEKAYSILGVSTTATDREVKGAYRRLISQHHPDKLVAKGLPEEMMKLATARTQEIKTAWERIREDRGI